MIFVSGALSAAIAAVDIGNSIHDSIGLLIWRIKSMICVVLIN